MVSIAYSNGTHLVVPTIAKSIDISELSTDIWTTTGGFLSIYHPYPVGKLIVNIVPED